MATRGTCRNKSCNPDLVPSGSTEGVSPEIIEGCKELVLSNDQLQQYMKIFLENVDRGLGKSTNPDSIVKCFPTFVQDLPDGTETGKFLALDLGGSNFRVLFVELGGAAEMKFKIFVIPPAIMTGPGSELFDFIADCLAKFIVEHKLEGEELPLGFTFSFPLMQKGLKVGILERWTKGFNCPDVIGNDVVQLLKEALDRRGDVKINICAVLNDTTGTLMACAYHNPNAKIGLIVGTGTNGCYVESQSKAELFDEPDMGSGKVLINLEWGAFGDDGALDFVRVSYDETVDANSINPGKQKHEKMISGMYMGELVRLAAERFTKEGLMFEGKGSDALFTSGKFLTSYVSDIESDLPGESECVKKVCNTLGLSNATEQDCCNLRYIASCISRRAAHMVAAGLLALMDKMGEKSLTVGIDGTLYKTHPYFHLLTVEKIKELAGNKYDFKLKLAEDGSGKGAALVAAVAAKKAQG